MIKLESSTSKDSAKKLLKDQSIADLLAHNKELTLGETIEAFLKDHHPLSDESKEKATKELLAFIINEAEEAIARGCHDDFSLDDRVLAEVDKGHQLIAWRTVRDNWLAQHNASLDGMYLSQRLARELPGFELCHSGYCKTTKRDIPEELEKEAEKVGGEVRWYQPERRLVVAVKFPQPFKHTDFARWTIKRNQGVFNSGAVFVKKDLSPEKWEKFVEETTQIFADTLRVSAKAIQKSGAVFNIRITVLDEEQND